MGNANGWGDGSVNNNIGWGQGANNTIGWGKSHLDSWSGATDIDGGNLPSNSVAPAITGTAQEGETLTCSTGTWSGSPTYTYQWKRNGNNIGGATSSTYLVALADVGQNILCTVTATNFVGSATANSNTVVPIAIANLLLDTYTNADVAYSLRKLRTAYTGSAIRVRRSNDNAEQDIAFSGNDLDTTTMLDFVGYNLLTYSEDITQQLVGGGRATYTNNVEVSPDSNLTGGKFATDGTFGEHYWFRNAITILNSTSYNISVYLKQAEFTKVRVSSNISGAAQNCDVDLTNGAISNNGFANTPIVTAEANGWYRFSVTITSGTTSASPISIRLYNTSGAISFVGDAGKGIYVWGTQLSQTSTVKTYQKTVATAGGNGFVTTWYDQSTNANNSTQATAANQAQIVLNGNLRLDPNNNKVSTQWTSDSYTIGTNITIAQNFLMFAVVNRAATNGVIHPLGSTSASPFIFRWGSTGNIDSQITTGAVSHATADTTIGDYVISALRDNSNVVKAWKNTNALSTGTSTGLAATITRFGLSSTTGSTGWYQELIYWNTDLESSRSAIETAINTYYSVY